MDEVRRVRRAEAMYRRLLVIYPRSFRQDYGAEMARDFRDSWHAADRQRHTQDLLRFWWRTIVDLARSARIEWLDALRAVCGGDVMLAKRLLDVGVASVALVITAPVMLMIALLIKLDSPGPIFFVSRRIGKDGRPFGMLKFRTMVDDSLTPGQRQLTRMGRLLRPAAIDEWPQFFNVLMGDMSLVGPRPELPGHIDTTNTVWQQILSIRPGMCGLAQLAYGGRYQPPADVRQELDLRYINSRSLLLDAQVLVKTFVMLVPPK